MLLISVRDSPCSSLALRSSFGRSTVKLPLSSRSIVIGSASVWESDPFGPLTVTFGPSIDSSTPVGTVIGLRPMRDI
jgi:hypothetical protein